MARLRSLYGRPELIIQTLLQKLHATPPPKDGKLETILSFALEVQNLYATIRATGLDAHLNNPTLLTQLENKLPPNILLNWGIHKMASPDCTLVHFSEWIYHLAEAANGVLVLPSITRTEENKGSSRGRDNKQRTGFLNSHSQTDVNNNELMQKCRICKGNCDSVAMCKEFQQLSRTLKWTAIREHRLCRRCLNRHDIRNCPSTSTCGKDGCTFRHHPLLHNEQTNSKGHCNAHHDPNNTTLFRMVPVWLYGNGVKLKTFAFLDDGSSLTLMDKGLASQLNLKGRSQPLCLKWTADTHRYESDSDILNLRISSTSPNAQNFPLSDVHTVGNLALPYQSLNFEHLRNKYEHLKGLPIESYGRETPRLLIGLKHTKLGLPLKCREGSSEEPVATKTRLGWILHGWCPGQIPEGEQRPQHHNFHICECDDAGLSRLVKNFISMDNFGMSNPGEALMPTEDKRALELLNAHTVRNDGRFETALLWKFDDFVLPDSLPMAKRRLACLHKRMRREPQLAKALDEKKHEFIAKGYAKRLSTEEIAAGNNRSWYLPIFPVFNPNKPGKLRIVWDAAATVQGISLNSMLFKGSGQLMSLVGVLFKFREDRVAIFADIMEMYPQIQIRKEDQHFQRFLWSKGEEAEPEVIVMQVMIMGATSASTSAQYVINKNADEFANKFPRAVRSIKNNQYVDDLMDSTSSPAEAIQLAKEIHFVHQQGGFFIRNWTSNSPEVVRAMNSEPTEQVNLVIDDVEMGIEKVLGMWWCTATDCFTYKINARMGHTDIFSGHKRPTKREVLRILMTIFDPLGLVANFLMYIKVLLQDIWRSNIGWDEEIKDAEYEKWLKWIRYLPEILQLQIPRCYIIDNPHRNTEMHLHVFVDASENGFAAVAYLRIASAEETTCVLIGAKTRVAPLKSLSIPRLELQAAVLGVRFMKIIIESHTLNISKRVFWSDSRNVLSWIRSDHRRYKPFVAFRVSEILDSTEISDWRWISTKLNVADEGTKWQKIPEFNTSNRWFTGPEFLKLHPSLWPKETIESETIEELKTCFINVHALQRGSNFRIDKTSSWKRLTRVAAYALRFIHNTSTNRYERKTGSSHPRRMGLLKQEELQSAETELFREAQRSEYYEEIADLVSSQSVEKGSILYNLCPYLDTDKIIRANSRVPSSTNFSESFRKPVILPRNHPITQLIIIDLHTRFNHRNHETVINELRQRFHIHHMRAALRAIRKNCQKCKISSAKPQPPMMAQLPLARVTPFCRPFSYVGIDYFGPMTVSILRRTEKRWGVLLTCLTTRAVHVEVAHSLSTDSCILALRNFMARRGVPIEIHSDNGTNFHGAERELKDALKEVNTKRLIETFTTTTTKWTFIPPGSPHMGGSWERLVRSIKTSLYDIMPTRNPSDELLRSMLIVVENIVNSRPLTYIPIDSENEEALTPNHFLLGSSNGSKPPAVFDNGVRAIKRNWLVSQQYAEHFWQRWVREYLPTITRRAKWYTPTKPIEKGDIVVIADPLSPRNCWPKGRVLKTKISKDGQVRSAFVQTQTGVYERPAVKLAVLDLKSQEDAFTRSEIPDGGVSNPA